MAWYGYVALYFLLVLLALPMTLGLCAAAAKPVPTKEED